MSDPRAAESPDTLPAPGQEGVLPAVAGGRRPGRLAGVAVLLRWNLAPVLVLCLIALAYLAWTSTDQFGAIDSDGPTYLMMAEHYAKGMADRSIGAIASSYARFPPLYPQLLHWLGAAHDLAHVHLLTSAFFILALAAFYAWLQLEHLPPWAAVLLLSAVSVMPQSWLLGLLIQSEYLYLAVSLLALAGLVRFCHAGQSEALYLAALAVAAAWLTRSIGFVLLLPLLACALCAPRRAAVLALLIAAAPGLLWSVAHGQGTGYSGSLLLRYGEQPVSGLWNQLAVELPSLQRAFERDLSLSTWAAPILDVLELFSLAAAAIRAWRRQPDGLYAIAYLGVLAVWPYPEDAQRLLWPVLPVLLVQPVLLLRSQSSGAMSRLTALATGGIVIICSLSAIALACDRVRASAALGRPELRGLVYWYDVDPARAKRWVDMEIAITDALRRIDTEVPGNECVLSTRPELINYFARRHATYPPPDSASDETFWQRLGATGCHYLFMTRRTYQGYPQPMYPQQRMGETLHLVDRCPLPPGNSDNAGRACALGQFDFPSAH